MLIPTALGEASFANVITTKKISFFFFIAVQTLHFTCRFKQVGASTVVIRAGVTCPAFNWSLLYSFPMDNKGIKTWLDVTTQIETFLISVAVLRQYSHFRFPRWGHVFTVRQLLQCGYKGFRCDRGCRGLSLASQHNCQNHSLHSSKRKEA